MIDPKDIDLECLCMTCASSSIQVWDPPDEKYVPKEFIAMEDKWVQVFCEYRHTPVRYAENLTECPKHETPAEKEMRKMTEKLKVD